MLQVKNIIEILQKWYTKSWDFFNPILAYMCRRAVIEISEMIARSNDQS